jgi:hypothetical protein
VKLLKGEMIKLFIFLGLILLFDQTALSQEKLCGEQITLEEILTKFKSASRENKSTEQINNELITEILKQKVIFELNAENENSLKSAGANGLLLKTIRENFPEEIKRMVIFYEIYLTNYQSSNIEQIKIALGVAKAFIENYKKNQCLNKNIDYFKEAIPVLETWIKRLDAAYKSKNYIEFFDIGAEILRVEPNFLDLILVLAAVGFDQAKVQGNNSKFIGVTIRYAELAVKLLKSGKESEYKDYGSYRYRYKTKMNALNKMNEIIEYMTNQKLN